jgi:dihydropteroate synthase
MPGRHKFALTLPSTVLVLGERTLVMGVLNVTPDSFSDGGQFLEPEKAIAHALRMQAAQADLIDIGGESARPGAHGISAEEELRRVLPVLRGLKRKLRIPICIDTTKVEVAEAALQAGAQMINDTSGLRVDPKLAKVAKKHDVPLVLMHIRGTPRTMQEIQPAKNIWREIEKGLQWSVEKALQAGLRRTQLVIDPGIGFGKTVMQNYEILRELPRLEKFKLPILVGPSRKTFIGKMLDNAPPQERLWGTAAAVTASILGGAHMVRVHDVAEMLQVVRVTDAVLRS